MANDSINDDLCNKLSIKSQKDRVQNLSIELDLEGGVSREGWSGLFPNRTSDHFFICALFNI